VGLRTEFDHLLCEFGIDDGSELEVLDFEELVMGGVDGEFDVAVLEEEATVVGGRTQLCPQAVYLLLQECALRRGWLCAQRVFIHALQI
jgi:hypothetical protein